MTKEEIQQQIDELNTQRKELQSRLDVLNKPSAKEVKELVAKRKALFNKIKQAAKSRDFQADGVTIKWGYDLDWSDIDEHRLPGPGSIERCINPIVFKCKNSLIQALLGIITHSMDVWDIEEQLLEIKHPQLKQISQHANELAQLIDEYDNLSRS